MKKKLFVISAAVLVVVLISAKLIANKAEVNEKNKIADLNFKSVTVNVKNVFRSEQNSQLTAVGSTAAQDELLLQSQGNGEIVSLNFKIGDYVYKGKLLAKIDDRLGVLALERAKLALMKAEDDYNKEKNLFAGNASTDNLLRDRKLDFDNAKINVDQAKKQLEFTSIVAPQNGYITEKFITRGTLVGPGSQIARIVDISKLKINVSMSESDIYKIKNGMSVVATSTVYPGVKYPGKVTFISSKGDQVHNYQVEVSINNSSINPLKAGTFTSVEFDMSSKLNVLLIPREALISSIKDAKVYSVQNGIAHLKNITVGKDFGDYLEVLNGISEGETVVTSGQINLSDGTKVVTLNK